MIRFSVAIVFAAALGLALAACDDKGAEVPAGDDQRSAEGEVLGGSISDSMLPLDTVTSTPPAMRDNAEGKSESGADGTAAKADAEEPAASAADAEEPAAASEPAAAEGPAETE